MKTRCHPGRKIAGRIFSRSRMIPTSKNTLYDFTQMYISEEVIFQAHLTDFIMPKKMARGMHMRLANKNDSSNK